MVENVSENTSIDWTTKKNMRAKLKGNCKKDIKDVLSHPPDKQKMVAGRTLNSLQLLVSIGWEWID